MLGLRTTHGLDPKEYERRFCRRFSPFLPFLEQCVRAGYACEEDGRWRLTPEGFLLSNQIIGQLLDLLQADKVRVKGGEDVFKALFHNGSQAVYVP